MSNSITKTVIPTWTKNILIAFPIQFVNHSTDFRKREYLQKFQNKIPSGEVGCAPFHLSFLF